MVIDDDDLLRRTIAKMVSHRYDVTSMARAREALDHLAEGARYDAILCDLIMPGMDGMEFYAQLGQMLPELASRVVFVTGGAVTAAARNFLEMGSIRCLGKPFNAEQALEALRAAAER